MKLRPYLRSRHQQEIYRGAVLLAAGAACVLGLAGCAITPLSSPPGDNSPAAVEAASQGARAAEPAPAPSAAAVSPQPVVAQPATAEPKPADAPAASKPIDPLRPDVRVDLDDRKAHEDLWARLRSGFTMPDLNTDLVHNREEWYAARPDYFARMTERGGRYLYHIIEEVEKRGMPTELALLPFIESAFNPHALSVANASGMWQFIPSTGRDFSLKQNMFRDDRRDVLASTRAALDYLRQLHGEFNDWHLTLAAYNWGVGNVRRAIARNEKEGLPTDYLNLRMPEETRYYVPKLQAVKNLVLKPSDFGVTLPKLANHPYFLSVPIERDIDVDLAARLAGMKTDEFKLLNPQMNKPMILAAATPQVLLPYDNANAFVRNLQGYRGPLSSWTAWVAPKTLRPSEAARQLGVSEAQLREINSIPARMLVKAGSTLVVPRTTRLSEDVSEEIADNATIQLAPDLPPVRRLSFKTGRHGDTVAAVAKRYRVSAGQVAQWNKVGVGGRFKPGQIVSVFVPAGSAVVMAKQSQASRPQVVAVPAVRPRVAAASVRVARSVLVTKSAPRTIVAKPAAKHVAPQRRAVAAARHSARATLASR